MKMSKIYSKEYFILIGIGFLPLMWKILEVSFLSSFDNALKILGQISLISIIFKMFEETLLNPLYKTLGRNCENSQEKNSISKKFLIWYVFATIIFTTIILLLNSYIMQASKVPDYIFDETLSFFNIYIPACGLGVVAKYLYTCNLINKDTKKMFIYLLIKSVFITILFLILVPKFTLALGVKGIAISELVTNIVAILYLVLTLQKTQFTQSKFNKKEYFKLLIFSFFETLIRNIVYYFVILVFINMLGNQDLYFVSNEFIWSVMLVPTLAQSSLIKQDFSNNKKSSLKPYFINSTILISFVIILIPVAFVVFKYIYNLSNYIDYFMVLLKLLPCYSLFIIDSIIEAYFISIGKLHHVLIQSVITNILVYLTALILYLCGIWHITLNSVIVLFNLGVVLSSLYTIIIYIVEKKKIDVQLINSD